MRSFSVFLLMLFAALAMGCSADADADGEIACEVTSTSRADCPDGMVCEYVHTSDRQMTDELICHEYCSSDDDCPAARPHCSPEIAWGSYVCSTANFNPRPCDPQATGDDCACGNRSNPAFRVEGTGEDCVILEEDVSACYEQANTCLNDCQPEFYRYDLGDGTAIIVLGLQGSISEGWVSDGQHDVTPASCPAITVEEEY